MAEEGRMGDLGSHSWAAAVVGCHYMLDYCCCILDYTESDPGSGSGSDVDIGVGSDVGDRPAACICLLHPSCISRCRAIVALAE